MSTPEANPIRLNLHGAACVLACLEHHPKAILELATTAEFLKETPGLSEKLKALNLRATVVPNSRELSSLVGHTCEDIYAVTRRPELSHTKVADFTEWRNAHETIVIADDFTRPEDLATLARSMASFGLQRLLLSNRSETLAYHPVAWQNSQGALERIKLAHAHALGGLLKLVEDRCCVVGFSSDIGRKIELANPVRVPGRHLALLFSGGKLDPDLQTRAEHCFRLPGQPPLSVTESIPLIIAWLAHQPKPRADGFLARKKARHSKKTS